MPIAFPSHVGLVAPLARLWPERVSALELFVGSMIPDVVDGAMDVLFRGHLGQWMGHSAIGTLVFCVPVGLSVSWTLRSTARAKDRRPATTPPSRSARLAKWVLSLDSGSKRASGPRRALFRASSVWLGALSHVFFDLISHHDSTLLWPWAPDPQWFFDAWYRAWFYVSPPGYPEYPIGLPFTMWLVLSGLGAWLFYRELVKPPI